MTMYAVYQQINGKTLSLKPTLNSSLWPQLLANTTAMMRSICNLQALSHILEHSWGIFLFHSSRTTSAAGNRCYSHGALPLLGLSFSVFLKTCIWRLLVSSYVDSEVMPQQTSQSSTSDKLSKMQRDKSTQYL